MKLYYAIILTYCYINPIAISGEMNKIGLEDWKDKLNFFSFLVFLCFSIAVIF